MSAPSGFGDPVRDPDEAEARMNAWAQGFAAKAARYREVGERTEQLRLTASSPNGEVQVTVRADGSPTDLRFGDRARTVPLENLSGMVLDTLRRAQAGIADRVAEVMADGLGDEDVQTRTLVLDNLRARFPDPETDDVAPDEVPDAPDRRRPAADGDEEENQPW
jgi:hypothetical protein